MKSRWYNRNVTPKRVLITTSLFVGLIAIAIMFFAPYEVRAMVIKEAQVPASFEQFMDPLFNVDFATFHMYNLSLRWYDEYENVTYSLSVSNVTALANHGHESLHGNDQAIIVFVHVHNFTFTSYPLRWEVYLDHVDVTLEFRVDDDTITYHAYVTKTTTLWHELTGW